MPILRDLFERNRENITDTSGSIRDVISSGARNLGSVAGLVGNVLDTAQSINDVRDLFSRSNIPRVIDFYEFIRRQSLGAIATAVFGDQNRGLVNSLLPLVDGQLNVRNIVDAVERRFEGRIQSVTPNVQKSINKREYKSGR